jgi:glucokinase
MWGGRRMKYALALDVGGTFLKSALISSTGSVMKKSFKRVPIDSEGSKERVINTFIEVLNGGLETAKPLGLEVTGIGVATPGPFDYTKGISLMKHKFQAIYGLSLRNEIINGLGLHKKFLVRFDVDAWSFLRGEAWCGAAKGYNRVVGVTLGTGLGSAFMVNDRMVIDGLGVPPNAWVGGLPYKKGIFEDVISKRGILSRYKELVKERFTGTETVKEIATQGLKHNEENSLIVFKELGDNLGKILRPLLLDFKAECLIMGGQISKSYQLFKETLENSLESIPTLMKVTRAEFIDLGALIGVTKLVFQKTMKNWGIIGVDK